MENWENKFIEYAKLYNIKHKIFSYYFMNYLKAKAPYAIKNIKKYFNGNNPSLSGGHKCSYSEMKFYLEKKELLKETKLNKTIKQIDHFSTWLGNCSKDISPLISPLDSKRTHSKVEDSAIRINPKLSGWQFAFNEYLYFKKPKVLNLLTFVSFFKYCAA